MKNYQVLFATADTQSRISKNISTLANQQKPNKPATTIDKYSELIITIDKPAAAILADITNPDHSKDLLTRAIVDNQWRATFVGLGRNLVATNQLRIITPSLSNALNVLRVTPGVLGIS